MTDHDQKGKQRNAGKRQEILRENRKIAETLQDLEQTSRSLDQGSEMGPLLAELQTLLHRHFEREDSRDGLHAAVTEAAVDLQPQVEQLAQEHLVLEEELEALREKSSEYAELAKELDASLRKLIDHLESHEAEENRVMVKSVYDVHGVGD